MRRANTITGFVLLGSSILIVLQALKMEYFREGVPGPGFIPFWIGIVLALLSLLLLFYNLILKRPDSETPPGFNFKFIKNSLIVIGSCAIALGLMNVLGMLISIGLLTGFLSWAFGTKSWVKNLLLTVLTPVAFWLIFVVGLNALLPTGLFGF